MSPARYGSSPALPALPSSRTRSISSKSSTTSPSSTTTSTPASSASSFNNPSTNIPRVDSNQTIVSKRLPRLESVPKQLDQHSNLDALPTDRPLRRPLPPVEPLAVSNTSNRLQIPPRANGQRESENIRRNHRPARLELVQPPLSHHSLPSPPLPLLPPPSPVRKDMDTTENGNGSSKARGAEETATKSVTPNGLKANPLEELIRTENLYVEDLGVIIKRVAAAWSRNNFPPPELDTMFRAIEAVYRINKSLLAQLNAIGPTPASPKALGDLLMRWIPDITPSYTAYLTLLRSSVSFDTHVPTQSNANLAPILTSLPWPKSMEHETVEEGSTTLDVLFGLPMERVRYYKRLFERLRRNTKEGRQDWEMIMKACRGVEDLERLADEEGERRDTQALEPEGRSSGSTGTSRTEVTNPVRKQTPTPRIEDLEARLCTDRALDIFTMLPKKCRLQISPPSLPYVRQIRLAGSVTLSFHPNSFAQPRQVTLQPAYLILLTDLFLICQPMTPEEQKTEPAATEGGADMWLVYPPLAGKHLKVRDGEREGELWVEVMKKEELLVRCQSAEEARMWKEGFEDVFTFAVSHPAALRPDSKTVRSPGLNSTFSGQSSHSSIASTSNLNLNPTLPSLSPLRPSPQARSASYNNTYSSPTSITSPSFDFDFPDKTGSLAASLSRLPRDSTQQQQQYNWEQGTPTPGNFQAPNQPRSVSAGGGEYRQPRSASLGPPGSNGNGTDGPGVMHRSVSSSSTPLISAAGTSAYYNHASSSNPSLPLSPQYGSYPSYPPGAGSSFAGNPNGPSRSSNPAAPNQEYDYAAGPFPNPSFPSSHNLHKSPSAQSFMTEGSGGYPPLNSIGMGYQQAQQQQGGRMATSRRTDPGEGRNEHEEAMWRSKSATDLRASSPSGTGRGSGGAGVGGGLGVGLDKRYRLPSQAFSNSAPGSTNGHFGNDYSPPGSPLRGEFDSRSSQSPRRSSAPETTTIVAQMRCKAFLQQNHAQWKSLGTAKLKLFVSNPSNVKQLVVESEKGGNEKKVLVSTIVLMDGVERVGKTGVAIELSDNGSRTGIVYMLQMKTEQAAIGLFEQFLIGSDRLSSNRASGRGR